MFAQLRLNFFNFKNMLKDLFQLEFPYNACDLKLLYSFGLIVCIKQIIETPLMPNKVGII